jgi:hypothetical protein
MSRLTEAVTSAPRSTATRLLDYLSNDLAAFTLGTPPFDDITFFVIVSEA